MSALRELIELAVPPVAPQGAPFDWPAAESALGTALPSDYKAFCDVYGHGSFFNGWLWVPHSPHGPLDDLLSSYWLDLLADVETEHRPYPEPGGVLPFLTSELNYLFAWRTIGPPDDWPVFVQTDGSDWRHFELSATASMLCALRDELFGSPELRSDHDVTFTSAIPRDVAPTPEALFVIRGHGYISSEGHHVTLDLGGALGGSRQARLDELLVALEPAQRARIVRASAKRSEEVLHVHEKADIDPLCEAIQAWANTSAGWRPS